MPPSTPTPKALVLPRSRRIKQGRDFARIRAQGRRLAHGCLAANWLPSTQAQASRLGVITSKRLGKAVQRNRARRLLREAFRLHQPDLTAPVDMVLIARQSIAGKQFTQVEADYVTVLRRGGLMKL